MKYILQFESHNDGYGGGGGGGGGSIKVGGGVDGGCLGDCAVGEKGNGGDCGGEGGFVGGNNWDGLGKKLSKIK